MLDVPDIQTRGIIAQMRRGRNRPQIPRPVRNIVRP
jgi:hypothetical protein